MNETVSIPRELSNRVTQLIQGIRPGRTSEQRRHEIADYVRRLIIKCFQPEHNVEAFMFGSVPLRTYLPDGDIDISIFCEPKGLQDTWCDRMSSVLENEAGNPEAEFKVANVSLINAEVKLLKCLVDNIVVDVSFNQIGGLCTLNFLEAMDRKIGGKHLFKQSIILIKAWCYYESRVLGAQHSLLSTYALETMVLYIFNVYHSELQTPLEVLYKFLIVFHHFEWESYCLTLSGPVSVKDLDINAVPVPPDQGKTLLLPMFMNVMLDAYSYTPIVPANSKGPGYPKYMNIMDPLLHSNNLGRSVSKTSEIRIRNAFGHGARLLNEIFQKELPEAMETLDDFFKNTWSAQQRPRLSHQPQIPRQQHGQSVTYATPGMRTGNGLLDLLKESQKETAELHDRDNSNGGVFPIPGYPAGPQAQANGAVGIPSSGNLAGIFPPPPPRVADDRNTMQQTTVGRAELEKLSRQLPPNQHIKNLFEMKSSNPQPFNAFAQVYFDSTHLPAHYPVQLYNGLNHPSMKIPLGQNAAHQQGGQSPGALQRTRSEPNIAELGTKKKDRAATTRYQPPYQVQNPKKLQMQAPEGENKQGIMEGRAVLRVENSKPIVQPSVDVTVKIAEATVVKNEKVSEHKNKGPGVRNDELWREKLEFDEDTKRRLDRISAKFKAAEEASEATENGADMKRRQTKDMAESVRDKEEKEAVNGGKIQPDVNGGPVRKDVHDQSIVIGEPPEPPALMGDGMRLDRDHFAAGRSLYRRAGRHYDYHPNLQAVDSRNFLIQMAQSQHPRQAMGRMPMADRQMHSWMELGPHGELLTSIAPVYQWFVNPTAAAAYSQTPIYNLLRSQGEHGTTPMTVARPNGVPTPVIKHPVMQKADVRNTLVDVFPAVNQQYVFARQDGSIGTMDRRLPAGTAPTMPTLPPGWNQLYTQVNGGVPPRQHEENATRESDCVLSGDIETLTTQLELARNFIGCKTAAVATVDKERSGRSPPSTQPSEKTPSNSSHRRGTPSPTMSSRPDSRASSREVQGRPPPVMDNPLPPTQHIHGPTATPVSFPAGFQAQAANLVYQMQPGYMGHPPPPPGVVSERISADVELLASMNGNGTIGTVPAGYNYQGNVRGMHLPLQAMGVAGGAAPSPVNVSHPILNPHAHLPPQPPRSASPTRLKDAHMARNGKPGGNRTVPMEVRQSISVSTDDGKTVSVDASVLKAVNAAIAEPKSTDHLASKDPNNQTSQGDTNSPLHPNGEEMMRTGVPDGSLTHEPMVRLLEKGVVCYTGAKELPAFSSHGPALNDSGINRNAGALASLFNGSNVQQAADMPPQHRGNTFNGVSGIIPPLDPVAHASRPTSYGTGSFIPRNRQNIYEELRLKEQQTAEKEPQLAKQGHGGETNTAEEGSWGNESDCTSSDKTDHNESRAQPRGRMTPTSGQPWSNQASVGSVYTQTPQRGTYPIHDPMRHVNLQRTSDPWPGKETGLPNPSEMNQYFKQYGDFSTSFISTEVMPRKAEHPRTGIVSYTNTPNAAPNQGYGEYPTNSYHAQSLSLRHLSQSHNGTHGLITTRNRRDGDRWTTHQRNEKSAMDQSSTSDSSHGRMRRAGTDPTERWETKRHPRHPTSSSPCRTYDAVHKPNRDSNILDDDSAQQQPPLDQLFNGSRQHRYRGTSINQRGQRNRRSSPEDDRSRSSALRDTEFPTLESARSSKHTSSPSSQSGSPRLNEKQSPPTTTTSH